MPYRAAPVTQRDGSALQYSNCRMASIATGIDYQTLGGTTSTGAKMRARQSDKEGGTDSSDAVTAWASYDQRLIVRDGETWDQLVEDLRAGRLVHIDVWHATAGGPCLSGSGGYGHTMAVAPESRMYENRAQWLVADPWCLPASWRWWDAAKLKAGAEKWGSQVFTRATAGWPRPYSEQELRILMRVAARELMERFRPDHEAGPDDIPDTGGAANRIMFTVTQIQAAETAGGGAMGIVFNPQRWQTTKEVDVFLDSSFSKKVTALKSGHIYTMLGVKAIVDADGKDNSARAILTTTGGLVPGTDDETQRTILWIKGADAGNGITTQPAWDESIWQLATHPEGRYPCPPAPDLPDVPSDCSLEVLSAIEVRDAQWEEALQMGAPWPTRS